MSKILYLVIPVFNEQAVLPVTAPAFLEKLDSLIEKGMISDKSRILFVDDGSRDSSWAIISDLAESNRRFTGIKLSRNRGHQNALIAGLTEASDKCDVTITVDCDGQDDINAIDKMVEEYLGGCDIVYGVRNSRKSDSFFKRTTARAFYKTMNFFGANTVYDHADYRLMSSRAVKALLEFKEVNLFLRGMVPFVGFKSTIVMYDRTERVAGKSKYTFSKMMSLALDGITGLSVKPIRYIMALGFGVSIISFVGIIWSVVRELLGYTVDGWASLVSIVCFLGGIQLLCIGVLGEYIGKIYLETKHRPRFIVEEKTEDKKF